MDVSNNLQGSLQFQEHRLRHKNLPRLIDEWMDLFLLQRHLRRLHHAESHISSQTLLPSLLKSAPPKKSFTPTLVTNIIISHFTTPTSNEHPFKKRLRLLDSIWCTRAASARGAHDNWNRREPQRKTRWVAHPLAFSCIHLSPACVQRATILQIRIPASCRIQYPMIYAPCRDKTMLL